MKFAVFGLGALGTVFATLLKEKGHTVYGITKRETQHLLQNLPFKVSGIWGEHRAVLDKVTSSLMDINEDIDYIILTVKSYDTKTAVRQIKPYIKGNTKVLLAQNGYGNYEIVSQEIGKDRTLLSRVIFGAKLLELGHAEVTVIADDVVIGQPEGKIPKEDIQTLVDVLNQAHIPTRYSTDVYKILWDKILYNCALNPLGALLECTYGQLASCEKTREVMDNIIQEIFWVAKEHNIKLNWETVEDYKRYFYETLIPPTSKHYPSMYYDLKSGKKLEIDSLNGAIVRLAHEKGIKVPVNETITNMIKTKEFINSN
ncbi:MAG: ketopantoate reductase family protein [Aquificae bacterium]|nr:ketopantoate reductase family protein [Aquificota bacterium]